MRQVIPFGDASLWLTHIVRDSVPILTKYLVNDLSYLPISIVKLLSGRGGSLYPWAGGGCGLPDAVCLCA